jgi:predicted Rossmann fold flavoprotein
MDRTSKKEKIICIGAGASGLFFALNRADEDHEVILLDRNTKVGRKMYISGKGRCNITNDCDVKTFINNIVTNPRFMYSAINAFKPADTIAFFNEHGCPLKTERGGRVFPVSDKASDIIDALFFECKRKGVRILFEQKVMEVRKKEGSFHVICEDKTYSCDRLVIATGGMSYASTGSTGDGYRFAESFGHHIVEPRSALCPIKVKERICHEMLKLTLRNVSLKIVSGKFKKEIFGDLEFLPGRITGPIVLSA